MTGNIYTDLPSTVDGESFTQLLARPGCRVERIVSTGQTTPEDAPYDQAHDEWVLLLKGSARMWLDGQGDRALMPGDHLLIPAHVRHRVTWTTPDEPTIWLALHFGE